MKQEFTQAIICTDLNANKQAQSTGFIALTAYAVYILWRNHAVLSQTGLHPYRNVSTLIPEVGRGERSLTLGAI